MLAAGVGAEESMGGGMVIWRALVDLLLFEKEEVGDSECLAGREPKDMVLVMGEDVESVMGEVEGEVGAVVAVDAVLIFGGGFEAGIMWARGMAQVTVQ